MRTLLVIVTSGAAVFISDCIVVPYTTEAIIVVGTITAVSALLRKQRKLRPRKIPDKKIPRLQSGDFLFKSLAVSYSRMVSPHYHRR